MHRDMRHVIVVRSLKKGRVRCVMRVDRRDGASVLLMEWHTGGGGLSGAWSGPLGVVHGLLVHQRRGPGVHVRGQPVLVVVLRHVLGAPPAGPPRPTRGNP